MEYKPMQAARVLLEQGGDNIIGFLEGLDISGTPGMRERFVRHYNIARIVSSALQPAEGSENPDSIL